MTTTPTEIAKTILEQLGGNKFVAMTGAKYFTAMSTVSRGDTLMFGLPGKGGFTKNGINKVTIRLTAADLYEVIFMRTRISRKKGFEAKEIAKYDGVYFDQLQEIFTRETGLATRL